METPKKTYSKQGGRPKVGIGRIRKYVVSTRLSPERQLRFSALCREAGQPPAEVLRHVLHFRGHDALGFQYPGLLFHHIAYRPRKGRSEYDLTDHRLSVSGVFRWP